MTTGGTTQEALQEALPSRGVAGGTISSQTRIASAAVPEWSVHRHSDTVRSAALDGALAELGFSRKGDRYVHPSVEFYLEFPPGPLAIGSDLAVPPAEVSIADEVALALSATDSCRDRLAGVYHWRDRQSLRLAVAVARHQAVDLEVIRKWSRSEGSLDEYEEFLSELRRVE
jgi:hypothetical protein